jgi:hypothetical protein
MGPCIVSIFLACCWIYIGILLGAHPILHISRIRVKHNRHWTLHIFCSGFITKSINKKAWLIQNHKLKSFNTNQWAVSVLVVCLLLLTYLMLMVRNEVNGQHVHSAVMLATTDSICAAHCHNQWGLTRECASVHYKCYMSQKVTKSNLYCLNILYFFLCKIFKEPWFKG